MLAGDCSPHLGLGNSQGAHHLPAQTLASPQTLASRRRVLGDDHSATLNSMNNLAGIRGSLGDLDGARDLQEQALAGSRRVLGDDHPYTLNCMYGLARTRTALGDLDLHEQVLAGRRRMLGDDHPDTLTSMNNLAAIRRELEELWLLLDVR